MEQYFDNIGNEINIDDEVLVLVPKSDATYRRAFVRDFKNSFSHGPCHFHCEVLIEYDIDRVYCNKRRWEQRDSHELVFTKKITKAWRSNSDIVKYKPEYFEIK